MGMSTITSSPFVKHSAVHQDYQRASSSSSPAYPYPCPPNLQRPAAIHIGYHRSSPAREDGKEHAHVKTSVSSANSSSSATSEIKPYQAPQPYRYSAQMERDVMNNPSGRQSRSSLSRNYVPPPSICGNSEMVEDHSAAVRYIQQRELEQDEPEEKDHALWILVSDAKHN